MQPTCALSMDILRTLEGLDVWNWTILGKSTLCMPLMATRGGPFACHASQAVARASFAAVLYRCHSSPSPCQ